MKSNLVNLAFRGCTAALTTLAMAAMVSTANAQTVQSFGAGANSTEINTTGYTTGFALGAGTSQAAGAYNFIYTANDLAADSSFGPNDVTMKRSGFTGPGGNGFVALDTDYPSGVNDYISTTVTGLKAGTVTINFNYAVDQQAGFDGAFTTTFSVSLGSQTDNVVVAPWTAADSASSATTATWIPVSLTFTVTNPADDILKFAANSVSTANLPSFLLLAPSVASQTTIAPTVPEPGSLALLSTGLLGLGGFVRSRFGKKS
jgi:hypothetical protein